MKKLINLIRDEEGASMAEYALLLGLISVGVFLVFNIFKNSIQGALWRATTTLYNAR